LSKWSKTQHIAWQQRYIHNDYLMEGRDSRPDAIFATPSRRRKHSQQKRSNLERFRRFLTCYDMLKLRCRQVLMNSCLLQVLSVCRERVLGTHQQREIKGCFFVRRDIICGSAHDPKRRRACFGERKLPSCETSLPRRTSRSAEFGLKLPQASHKHKHVHALKFLGGSAQRLLRTLFLGCVGGAKNRGRGRLY
jgi:hypothetical protein